MTEKPPGHATTTETIAQHAVNVIIHKKSPYLVVYIGRDAGKRFELQTGRTLSIGRSAEADVTINDDRISRFHCAVDCTEEEITAEDLQSKNGTFVDGETITKQPITTESSIQIGQTVMRIEYKDKSEIQYEDELFRNATTDSVTGIPNRHYFVSRSREELPLARRTNAPVALVMLDIDFFKKINDTVGHQAGDYVLSQCASLISADKREEDLLGRYGGDEFILMIRGKITQSGVRDFCERVCTAVNDFTFCFDNKDIPVTLSIGVCFAPPGTFVELDELIGRADRALYAAKEKGRNAIEVHVAGTAE